MGRREEGVGSREEGAVRVVRELRSRTFLRQYLTPVTLSAVACPERSRREGSGRSGRKHLKGHVILNAAADAKRRLRNEGSVRSDDERHHGPCYDTLVQIGPCSHAPAWEQIPSVPYSFLTSIRNLLHPGAGCQKVAGVSKTTGHRPSASAAQQCRRMARHEDISLLTDNVIAYAVDIIRANM